MPKIQVVVSQAPNKVYEVVYIGYERQRAWEIFYKENKRSCGHCAILETDEDTEIDLDLGKEEEDE